MNIFSCTCPFVRRAIFLCRERITRRTHDHRDKAEEEHNLFLISFLHWFFHDFTVQTEGNERINEGFSSYFSRELFTSQISLYINLDVRNICVVMLTEGRKVFILWQRQRHLLYLKGSKFKDNNDIFQLSWLSSQILFRKCLLEYTFHYHNVLIIMEVKLKMWKQGGQVFVALYPTHYHWAYKAN